MVVMALTGIFCIALVIGGLIVAPIYFLVSWLFGISGLLMVATTYIYHMRGNNLYSTYTIYR